MPTCRLEGCGAEVIFVPTGDTKPSGQPVQMILDAAPIRPVKVENGLAVSLKGEYHVDHHGTCEPFRKMQEAKRGRRGASAEVERAPDDARPRLL